LDGRPWAGLRWPTATFFEPFRPGVSPLAGLWVGGGPCPRGLRRRAGRRWRPCRACLGLGDAYPGRCPGLSSVALAGLVRDWGMRAQSVALGYDRLPLQGMGGWDATPSGSGESWGPGSSGGGFGDRRLLSGTPVGVRGAVVPPAACGGNPRESALRGQPARIPPSGPTPLHPPLVRAEQRLYRYRTRGGWASNRPFGGQPP